MHDDYLRPYGRGGRWTVRSTTPEKLYPKLADSPTIAPHATTAWSWGSYVQLQSAIDADFYPHSVHVAYRLTQNNTGSFIINTELEIASGAAGSETALHSIPDSFFASIATAGAAPAICRTYPLGPAPIASGLRLAARMRHDGNGDTDVNVRAGCYVSGYESPVPLSDPAYPLDEHLAGANTPHLLHAPAGSTLSIATASYATGYGSWVEVISSSSTDILVWGVSAAQSGGSQGKHLQLGIGAAGSEVVCALLGVPDFSGIYAGVLTLRRPLLVRAGERLAARTSGGSGNLACRVLYEEL